MSANLSSFPPSTIANHEEWLNVQSTKSLLTTTSVGNEKVMKDDNNQSNETVEGTDTTNHTDNKRLIDYGSTVSTTTSVNEEEKEEETKKDQTTFVAKQENKNENEPKTIAGKIKKGAVTVGGSALIAVGIPLIPTPVPGILFIAGGLSLLGTEYPEAQAILEKGRDTLEEYATSNVVTEDTESDVGNDKEGGVSLENSKEIEMRNEPQQQNEEEKEEDYIHVVVVDDTKQNTDNNNDAKIHTPANNKENLQSESCMETKSDSLSTSLENTDLQEQPLPMATVTQSRGELMSNEIEKQMKRANQSLKSLIRCSILPVVKKHIVPIRDDVNEEKEEDEKQTVSKEEQPFTSTHPTDNNHDVISNSSNIMVVTVPSETTSPSRKMKELEEQWETFSSSTLSTTATNTTIQG